MKKNVLIGLGGVVLVLAVFIWQVVANLDGIVAGVIEEVGTEVLGTKVSVTGVSINLKEAKAGIAGLTIANPDGYSSANLFEMEGIEVDLNLESVGKDVLVIDAIRIQNPKIVFEGDESGGSNMQALLNNIEAGSSDGSSEGSGESSGETTKLIIDSLVFTGGQIKASSELKPGEVIDVKLPGIKMSRIGRTEGGVTPDVIATEVVGEMANAIIKAVAKAMVTEAIEEKTKGFLDKLKGD